MRLFEQSPIILLTWLGSVVAIRGAVNSAGRGQRNAQCVFKQSQTTAPFQRRKGSLSGRFAVGPATAGRQQSEPSHNDKA